MEGGWKREREDRPGKIWCSRSRENCKACNSSLLCKLHVEEGKALSLPAQSSRQAVPQLWRGALSVISVLMRGEKIPCSAPVLPRGKTNASWTLGSRESCRFVALEKTEMPEKENVLLFLVQDFTSTDWSQLIPTQCQYWPQTGVEN